MFAHFLHFHFFKNNKNWILEVFLPKENYTKFLMTCKGWMNLNLDDFPTKKFNELRKGGFF